MERTPLGTLVVVFPILLFKPVFGNTEGGNLPNFQMWREAKSPALVWSGVGETRARWGMQRTVSLPLREKGDEWGFAPCCLRECVEYPEVAVDAINVS